MARVPDGFVFISHMTGLQVSLEEKELIMCRHCMYWRQEVTPTEHWVCTHHSFDERKMHTTPDFYCADGRADNVPQNQA